MGLFFLGSRPPDGSLGEVGSLINLEGFSSGKVHSWLEGFSSGKVHSWLGMGLICMYGSFKIYGSILCNDSHFLTWNYLVVWLTLLRWKSRYGRLALLRMGLML